MSSEVETDTASTSQEAAQLPARFHVAVNGWFTGRSATGSGQYIDHLLAHLAQRPDSPRITLLLPDHGREAPPGSPTQGIDLVTCPLPRLPAPLRKLWWEQVTVPHMARRLAADVLWIPYWASPFWQPCPVVVTIHDLIPLLAPAYRTRLIHRLYTALVSFTARRAHSVLTVSHASAADISAHLRIPSQRVHVIYHGVDTFPGQNQRDATWLEAVRQKYNLPSRYFLYLGGFDVRKNVPAVVRAYRRYLERGGDPAIRLVLAGKLPQAHTPLTPDPRQVAAEVGLAAQVYCCGWVEEQDKLALYALATAFVFPSLYEGFGMMVAEAMAAGAPVITSGD
jgi:glycosyltransferase involved in cell wall biosynthesis